MLWEDQSRTVETIKATCFDTQDIDPEHLDRSTVVKAQSKHKLFALVNEEHFFCLFKRAASEWILAQDELLSKKKEAEKKKVTKAPLCSTSAKAKAEVSKKQAIVIGICSSFLNLHCPPSSA